jgi:hypothetical protein
MPVRTVGAVLVEALLIILSGCGAPDQAHPALRDAAARGAGRGTSDGPGAGGATSAGRAFLTVDFQRGQTLRYRFASQRKIVVDWDPNAVTSSNRVQEQTESFEMVVAYTAVAVNPFGASTIRATVESVRAARSGGSAGRNMGSDAVQAAQGKSFALQVDPRGKIVDATELLALVQELGQRAFRTDTSRGRTKDPDMIGDFIASQWFLWDAQASVEHPAEGLTVGQTWSSKLSIPTPMVMRRARNVVYRLAEILPTEAQSPWPGQRDRATPAGGTGPLAVIRSTYSSADSTPADWPIPYSGRFQMSGTFGFLGPYQVLGLEGGGEELFDLQAGRIEQRRETYTLRIKAGMPPLGIRANPHITIEQTLTMERAE